MKIVIPGIPPSLNKFAGRKNDREWQQAKRDWAQMVYLSCPRGIQPYTHALVTIRYYFPDERRRDPDNYSGKMLLDGLTAANVIFDDDFDHIDLQIVKGGVDRNNPHTEIEVTGW